MISLLTDWFRSGVGHAKREIEATRAVWTDVRSHQKALRTASEQGTDALGPERLAQLDDRYFDDLDTEEVAEGALSTWAELRRRQGDAAAVLLERDGVDPAWLAALNERIDACAEEEVEGPSDPGIVADRTSAHNAIGRLVNARDHPDPGIRSMASQALRSCVWQAMPDRGAQRPSDNRVHRLLDVVDRAVWTLSSRSLRLAFRSVDLSRRTGARRVRFGAMLGMVVGSGLGVAAMAQGRYPIAMACLVIAVAFDVLEGSIGRMTSTETPVGRWASCLVGHFAEFAFVAAIAADQLRLDHAESGFLLLGAVVVAQYGTLARTSARILGDPPSFSVHERAVRFVSIFAYGALMWAGRLPLVATGFPIGPSVTAVLFGGTGVQEVVRVTRAMRRRPVDSVLTIVESSGESESYVVERAATASARIF